MTDNESHLALRTAVRRLQGLKLHTAWEPNVQTCAVSGLYIWGCMHASRRLGLGEEVREI